MIERPRSIINKNGAQDIFLENELSSPSQLREKDKMRFPELYRNEMPLTEKEIVVFNLINNTITSFAKKYNTNVFPIEKEDVHKVPRENIINIIKNEGAVAMYNVTSHQTFFHEQGNPVSTFSFVQHEIIHATSFTIFEKYTRNNKFELGVRKNGVTTGDKEYVYFDNLNEAITEYISKKISNEMIKNTKFKEDSNTLLSELNIDRSLKSFPIIDSEEVVTFEMVGSQNNISDIKPLEYAYKPQRQFFVTLLEDIQKKNPQKYKNLEEVEDIFFRAYFGGDLKEMEKVIDDTYGEGTVKKLRLIDRCKYSGQPNLNRGGERVSALIENIKNENQS